MQVSAEAAERENRRVRRRVYGILSRSTTDRFGRAIAVALLLLIAANVSASILETDEGIAARAAGFFRWFEVVSVCIFTVEYVLRIWSCTADPAFAHPVWGRLRFAMQPMSLIDLAAIAPFYVDLIVPGAVDLRFLRSLRLLRLFRLMRSHRFAHAVTTLGRVARAKRIELGVTFAFVLIATIVAAGALYLVERDEPGTAFTSIPRAMWWSIATITTIGYGDMVPVTVLGRIIGGLVAFVGICALALPVGILSSGFIEELNRRKPPAPDGEQRTCTQCGQPVP